MCIVLVIQLPHRISIQAWPPCMRNHASTALVRENGQIGIRLDDQIRLSYSDFANHGLSSPPSSLVVRVGLGIESKIKYKLYWDKRRSRNRTFKRDDWTNTNRNLVSLYEI